MSQKVVKSAKSTKSHYQKDHVYPSQFHLNAKSGKEWIAMDLRHCDIWLILHIIDLCTRMPAAPFIPNKRRDTIIREFFQIRVAVNGSPQKVLVNNRGDFANDDFIKMTEALEINVLTTAGESTWCNRVV